MGETVVRFVEDGDIETCNHLHNTLRGLSRTTAQWHWEFSGYDERPRPFVVVERDGEILGTQALIPIRMIDRQGEFWTAKSEETLLSPDLRGQGLLERMYGTVFEWAEKRDFHSVWGFTHAAKALRRVGFLIPTQTGELFLPLSLRVARQISSRSEASTGPAGSSGGRRWKVAARALAAAGATGAALASRVLTPPAGRRRRVEIRDSIAVPEEAGDVCRAFVVQWGGATVFRDKPFLDWRLASNPYVKVTLDGAYVDGRLAGWIAYVMDDDGMGYIVDLIAASPDLSRPEVGFVAERLLLHAKANLRRRHALGIRAWTVTSHPFDQVVVRRARRAGFLKLPIGQSVVLWPLPSDRASMRNFEEWYVTRIYAEGRTG